MAMTTQEQRILNPAVVALERTTGIHARVRRTRAGRDGLADAIIEIEMYRRKRRFGAEVKTVHRFETPVIVKARDSREPHLLAAPYITREVAERCRHLHLPFIDTAGNAYLEGTGLLIYVVGQARPPELHHKPIPRFESRRDPDRLRAAVPSGTDSHQLSRDRSTGRCCARHCGARPEGPRSQSMLPVPNRARSYTHRPGTNARRMGHALSHDSPSQAQSSSIPRRSRKASTNRPHGAKRVLGR